MLKKYETHQKKVRPNLEESLKSGVACSEKKCKGEMMILRPEQVHPELKELRRANCNICKWRGWV